MKTIDITKKSMLTGVILGWLFFVLLAVNDWNPFGLLWIVGTPFLLLLPGALTTVLFRITHISVWARIVLSVGLSVLEVMTIGLLGNAILPLFGIIRPLDTVFAVWELSTLVFVLLFLTWWRLESLTIRLPRYGIADTKLDLLFLLIPFVFVVMSILGATQLNNGGSNVITMTMLASMGIYTAFVFRFSDRLAKHIAPTALFLMSLALLLMTSLRGWNISGHDIQREFFVFQLAKDAGLWNMATYLDAYNACISITIFPTLLVNILHTADAYVYKVLFQLIFAISTVVTFLISRRWLTVRLSFLAGLLFMAFPTFFQDMPFLARQEIAFLFYGLMLYVLFEKHFSLRMRQALFVMMGIGVILSHYATTYTILFVLLLTTVSMPLLLWLIKKTTPISLFRNSVLMSPILSRPRRKITLTMVGILIVASMFWTSIITGTDGHVRQVSQDIWSAIQDGFEGSSRSGDVLLFFTFGRISHERTMEEYVHKVVNAKRADSPDEYYATSTYSQYPLVTLPQAELPATGVGSVGIAGQMTVGNIVLFFGQLLVKVMQAGVLLGLAYALFRRRWLRELDPEYFMLAVYSMLFIALTIVLPLLSREYGVFRALQQSMFVLAPFMVLGALVLGSGFAWLFERWCRIISRGKLRTGTHNSYVFGVAGVLAVLFFLYATGFMSQLVGNNLPAVHLNNTGDDYDHYVTQQAEVDAILWLKERFAEETISNGGEQPIVHADRFGEKKLHAEILLHVNGDIFPGSIFKDAYVFIGPAILKRGTAYVNYEGALLKYSYPVEFLEENKELVYDNGDVRIYR